MKRARPLVHALIEGFDGFIGSIPCCSNDLNACCLSREHHRMHRDPAVQARWVTSSQLRDLIEVPGIALWIQFCARCQPSPVLSQLLCLHTRNGRLLSPLHGRHSLVLDHASKSRAGGMRGGLSSTSIQLGMSEKRGTRWKPPAIGSFHQCHALWECHAASLFSSCHVALSSIQAQEKRPGRVPRSLFLHNTQKDVSDVVHPALN